MPTPVAKLTAACPLLPADELGALLGGGTSQTRVTATEEKPDVSNGFTHYYCKYGSNGKYPFALGVTDSAKDGYTPPVAIDAIAKGSQVTTHSVTGVGAAGVFYTQTDGNSVLAAAKQSYGETRTVIFVAPVVVPEQKLIDVTKVVIDRI
jgi:hypothetical protein